MPKRIWRSGSTVGSSKHSTFARTCGRAWFPPRVSAMSRHRLTTQPFVRRSSCRGTPQQRSEEHTSELQSHSDLVCRLLLEKKKKKKPYISRDIKTTRRYTHMR